MNGGFHPRDCVACLYVPRAEGGRGLSSVEDCVEQARKSQEKYVQNGTENLVTPSNQDARLKMLVAGKINHCMVNLQDRTKTREMKKHGCGLKPDNQRETETLIVAA